MFKLILASALVACALAISSNALTAFGRPPTPIRPPTYPAHVAGPVIEILRSSSDIHPDGSYQWNYDTANGISAQEQGSVQPSGPEQANLQAQGSYSYTSPEGEKVSISYLADGNGFQPQGSHIPVAPAVPAAIQRALDWIAAHPQSATGHVATYPTRVHY